MFRAMKDSVRDEVVRILPAIGAGAFAKEEEKAREVVKHIVEIGGGEDVASTASPLQSDKTGRNDLCTCGSGKKYKKCCGK